MTGTDLAGGNIEFWPNNYGPDNSANVPNASSEVYDFGDQPTDPADGYGSMQVHNHDAKQTLFALNHWSEGSRADLGIRQPAHRKSRLDLCRQRRPPIPPSACASWCAAREGGEPRPSGLTPQPGQARR